MEGGKVTEDFRSEPVFRRLGGRGPSGPGPVKPPGRGGHGLQCTRPESLTFGLLSTRTTRSNKED